MRLGPGDRETSRGESLGVSVGRVATHRCRRLLRTSEPMVQRSGPSRSGRIARSRDSHRSRHIREFAYSVIDPRGEPVRRRPVGQQRLRIAGLLKSAASLPSRRTDAEGMSGRQILLFDVKTSVLDQFRRSLSAWHRLRNRACRARLVPRTCPARRRSAGGTMSGTCAHEGHVRTRFKGSRPATKHAKRPRPDRCDLGRRLSDETVRTKPRFLLRQPPGTPSAGRLFFAPIRPCRSNLLDP